jgi:aminopeptidase
MRDPRIDKLANTFVNHSVRAQAGDVVMIDHSGEDTRELANALSESVVAAGATPLMVVTDATQVATFVTRASEAQIKKLGEKMLAEMQGVQCYIAIRGGGNIFELGDIPEEKMALYIKHIRKPVHLEQRVRHTRWAITRYPNPSMAQLAGRSSKAFEDFFFDACLVDYAKMNNAQKPLKALMERTDRVRIQAGSHTDFSLSIKGIPAVICSGTCNIPDGECFTAPVRDSINGKVLFNTKTVYNGTPFQNISLVFKDGKIVEASDDLNTKKLNEILDKDEGARYVGEFAIGFHPTILHPMCDILFDEKISGSFHMAMGACYKDEAPNGNDSGIHWDMVQIQRPEYGGGKIWFDDVLIRENGVFVHPELKGLNPEALKA